MHSITIYNGNTYPPHPMYPKDTDYCCPECGSHVIVDEYVTHRADHEGNDAEQRGEGYYCSNKECANKTRELDSDELKPRPTEIIMAKNTEMTSNGDLTDWQIQELQKGTPKAIIAKVKLGGGEYDYIPHSYFTRRLNTIFRHRWTFEIVKYEILTDWMQVVVHGRLKVMLGNGLVITKDQVGGASIKCFSKGANAGKPMDVSNDLKAAVSESKKKCASELGIGEDVYGKVLDKLSMELVEMEDWEVKDIEANWQPRIDSANNDKAIASVITDLTKSELTLPQRRSLMNRITIRKTELSSDGVFQELLNELSRCSTMAEYVSGAKKKIEAIKTDLPQGAYETLMLAAKHTVERLGGNTSIIPERQ